MASLTRVIFLAEHYGGKKAHLGYVLAGTDPVAIDCAGLELLRTVEENWRAKL